MAIFRKREKKRPLALRRKRSVVWPRTAVITQADMAKKHPNPQKNSSALHSPDLTGTHDTAQHDEPQHVPDHAFSQLLHRLRAGRVVLCTGSVFAHTDNTATFRGLLGRLFEHHADRLGDEASVQSARALLGTQPLWLASLLRQHLGDDLLSAIREALPTETRADVLDLAVRLPFRGIVSTALDDGLAQAAARLPATLHPPHIGTDPIELLRDRGRFLLRLCGEVQTGQGLLFGEADVQNVFANEPLRQTLRDLALKRSLLFCGFDVYDPDFAMAARLFSLAQLSADGPKHFAVLPGLPPALRSEISRAYGLCVLDETDVLSLFAKLQKTVGEAGSEIMPDDDDLDGWLRLLQLEPNHAGAREKLSALADKLQAQNDTDHLIELWLGRMDVEASHQARAACLVQVAGLFETAKGQHAEAFHALLAAYKEDPQQVRFDEVERLASQAGAWVELLSELRDFVPKRPCAEQVVLWLRIAKLYGEKLNHLEYALASLAEAQKLGIPDAEQPGAAALHVDLTRRAQKWKDLAAALDKLALQTADPEKKIDLYLEQGELLETRLSDVAGAVAAYQAARKLNAAGRDALLALERVLRRASRWDELIVLLDEKADAAHAAGDAEAELKARREAAQFQAEHGTDRKATVSRFEQVRALCPDDVEVVRTLERLYSADGAASETYLNILSELARLVSSDKERLTLLRRLSAEYEDLVNHTEQAVSALFKIIDTDCTAQDAYRSLVRLLRQLKDWPRLCSVLQRQAEHTEKGAVDIWMSLARVYEVDIPAGDETVRQKHADQAIGAWQKVLLAEPEHPAAIEALGRLYQLAEKPADAVRYLTKRAHLTDDKELKVSLLGEAARLYLDKLGDNKAAEEHWVRALEILPSHGGSHAALGDLYRKQGDHKRAARAFLEAYEVCRNRLEKGRLAVATAQEFAAAEDRGMSFELLRQWLLEDPEHTEATHELAEMLWRDGRVSEAVPLLEMLTRKEADRDLQVSRLNRLAQAYLKAGLKDKARRAYRRALELSDKDVTALRGLLPLLFETGQYVDAWHVADILLSEHLSAFGQAELCELYASLGQALIAVGNLELALTTLEKALAIQPLHTRALLQLRRLEHLTPEQKLEVRQTLLRSLGETAAEPGTQDPRPLIWAEIGDLYLKSLGQPEHAVTAYERALSLAPLAVPVLQKTLDLYLERKMWPEAIGLLQQLTDAETSLRRRARYKQTAGFILRDHMAEPKRALRFLWSSFDDDPTLMKSLESAENLAAALGEPAEILKALQRRIKLLGPDANDTPKQRAERLRMWTEVSRLCLQELRDLPTGLSAYEVTLRLDPQNTDRHRQMAAIYSSAGPDFADKAIEQHLWVLAADKSELTAYQALRDLYELTGQQDKRTQVACVLALLGQGNDTDRALAEAHRPVQLSRRRMTKELWRQLAHPEEDSRMAAILALLWPALKRRYARPFSEHPFADKDRVEVSTPLLYLKALRYAFEMTESPVPDLYPRPQAVEMNEHSFLLSIACANPGGAGDAGNQTEPVVCAELGPPLLDPSRPEREILYEVGRMAGTLRPERAARLVLADEQDLAEILEAVFLLANQEGSKNLPPVSAQVLDLLGCFRTHLQKTQLDQVARVGRSLLDSGGQPLALAKQWLSASELTTIHTGLLVCGDLETAALLLATDPPGLTLLSPKQRLLDLLFFSISEELRHIRQYLAL